MTHPLPRIFISVASFCDPLLVHTVGDGVAKAAHPQRLSWGVVDQHTEPRQMTLKGVIGTSQLRYLQVHPAQSRGVCWARALVGSLYAGEEFLLQIDSHMLFEPSWDVELLQQMDTLRLRSPRPILSVYPYGFSFEQGKPVVTEGIDPQAALFSRVQSGSVLKPDDVTLTFTAEPVAATEAPEGFHLAGGFLFAPGRFLEEVPYDPQLYFHGEEQSLALRAYTRGWDIFHPTRIPLYHHYKPAGVSHDTQHWQPRWEAQRDFSFQELTEAARERLIDLVDQRRDLGAYGLGTVRSLESYASASGIDYPHRALRPPLGSRTSCDEDDARCVHVVELNPHHPRPFVFTDYAKCLVESLRSAGYQSQHVVNALPYKGRLLMLGWTPEWLQANAALVHPGRAILFNAEQLGITSTLASGAYVQALRGWTVADIHESNARFIQDSLGDETKVVELPVAPHASMGLSVTDVDAPMVDVLFVGSTSERRKVVLQAIMDSGLTVRHVEGAYGLELMALLQKARLMLHIHYYEARPFPVLRMLRPVMMGLPVVCEDSFFSAGNDWSNSGMVFCGVQDMVGTCHELLADPERREQVARACRLHAQRISPQSAWQALFDAHSLWHRRDA